MKPWTALLLLSLSLSPAGARADQKAPPLPLTASSANGEILFKLDPGPRGWASTEEAFGAAYRVEAKGGLTELWKTKGWYCEKLFVADDGRFVVGIGTWQTRLRDLALLFCDRGQVVKTYAVTDLVKPELVERSVSHYWWRPQVQTVPNGISKGSFHLVVIDHAAYEFDLQTGNITKTSTDEGARSGNEVRREEDAAAEKKGRAIYERSSCKAEFDARFEVSEIQALNGSISGVSLKGPEWFAHLTPKKKLAQKCTVEAVFLIVEDKLRVTLTPEQIEQAFERCLAHPFVAERFAKWGATGLRLRITGDRLHWDTPKLQEYLKQLKAASGPDAPFDAWAYFIIDDPKLIMTSGFLNTKTNELIHEDRLNYFTVPVLFDGSGTVISRAAPPTR